MRVTLISAVVLLLIHVAPAQAQSSGTLTGTVYDPVGATMEGILGRTSRALLRERWNAATVRGIAVAASLRLTIELVRCARPL